ncbi:MAG: VWA domain-containing protein [Ferruginibacter sp.]|nr:VWA domain-containing protein [Ferruginibacter sp.]
MFQFQHIEYLTGLAAVPLMVLLYFFVIRWKKSTLKKIGDAALVNQLISDYSPAKFSLKFVLFIAAFTVGVLALANPRMPLGTATVHRSGIDVMIALDVSKSMLAQDIKPDRLERAKQLLAKLIDKLSEDRIGIVVFAGRAYLQMPLTTDHAAAKMYLSSATPGVVPTQGTVIGDALKMCNAAFNVKEKKYKSIILISDGEDHDDNAVKLAKALASEGVMINTIGIGSPEGAMIVDAETNEVKRDATGAPVVTKLNEIGLKDIAVNGNGIYQLFTNTDEVVSRIETQLKSLGQKPITENSLINFQYFFPWLLALVLIVLLAEFLVSEIKSVKKNLPSINKKKVNPVTVLLIFFIAPSISFAQNDNKLVKKGNEAYKKKQYEVAREDYKKAAEKNPANQKAQYNLGNALYKTAKPEEAVAAYDAAIQNSRLAIEKSGAFYNKGVVLQNEKKLPECIDAYKNSLRLNPADEDARLNLQKALQQQQKQQQQQKEKDNKEQKKPKDEPQKKDQPKQQEDNNKNDLPQPQPSKMTKKEAEEKLKALLQQEKKLQDKLRRVNAASPEKPEKDW